MNSDLQGSSGHRMAENSVILQGSKLQETISTEYGGSVLMQHQLSISNKNKGRQTLNLIPNYYKMVIEEKNRLLRKSLNTSQYCHVH